MGCAEGGERSTHATLRSGVAKLAWIAVAVALGMVVLAISPSAATAASVTTIERPAGDHSKRSVLRYWTRERMRKARPLPPRVLKADGSSASKRAIRRTRERSARAVFDTGEVLDFDVAPNTTNGKVFARMPGVGLYECSATVVDSPSGSVVFTAGHCVAEAPRTRAVKFIFVPSYRQKDRPLGRWVFERIIVPDQWARRGNFNFDMAAVVLAPRAGVPVQQVTGARGIAWNESRRHTYTAYGYPINRANGQRMWYCTSSFLRRDPKPIGYGPIPSGIGCDMGAGASGGGWIIEDGRLNSVTSFGYGRRGNVLYGPYFGNMARHLYGKAAATPAP